MKEYNFYDKPHKYYACLQKSIDRPDIPVSKNVVRGETMLSGWIIEEDPNNPKDVRFALVNHADAKGYIPAFLIRRAACQYSEKMFSGIESNYKKMEEYFNSKTQPKPKL